MENSRNGENMPGTCNGGPGYRQHPDYEVRLVALDGEVEIRAGGEVIVRTGSALEVIETGHRPAIYVPLADAREALLSASDSRTYCPFKGYASYHSVRLGDELRADVFWQYVSPFDEVAGLAGYLGVYPDRVDAITVNGEPRA